MENNQARLDYFFNKLNINNIDVFVWQSIVHALRIIFIDSRIDHLLDDFFFFAMLMVLYYDHCC